MNFPFGGQILTVRQTPISDANSFLLGVYASAVHARWLNPDRTERVKALAVANEPQIFWDGTDAGKIISSIHIPEEAGYLVEAARNLNGPSGLAVDDYYLAPLGLSRASTWMCDLLPQHRQNEGQRRAVRSRYVPVAQRYGLAEVSVPAVPRRFVDALRLDEIVQEWMVSGATTVVTLGDKPLEEFISRAGLIPGASSLRRFGLTEAEYGKRHPFAFRGRRFELLPLVHPRHAAGIGMHSPVLRKLHASWVRRQRLGKD